MKAILLSLLKSAMAYFGAMKHGESRAKNKQKEADNAELKKDQAVDAKPSDTGSVFDRLRNIAKRK